MLSVICNNGTRTVYVRDTGAKQYQSLNNILRRVPVHYIVLKNATDMTRKLQRILYVHGFAAVNQLKFINANYEEMMGKKKNKQSYVYLMTSTQGVKDVTLSIHSDWEEMQYAPPDNFYIKTVHQFKVKNKMEGITLLNNAKRMSDAEVQSKATLVFDRHAQKELA